jgi:hypothetical protein
MKKTSIVVIVLMLVVGALSSAYATDYSYTMVNYPGALYSLPYGINNAGTIVGVYGSQGFTLSGTTYRPVNYPGAVYTIPQGISNGGTIVGQCWGVVGVNSFTLSGTTYSPLIPGGGTIVPYGINNAGTIVGAGPGGGTFWPSGGVLTALYYPSGIQGSATTVSAYGINDAGTIVGTLFTPSPSSLGGGVWQGFSLSNYSAFGSGPYTTLNYPGALDTWVYGINDTGTIVGTYGDASGAPHGFEGTPVPVPASLFLFGPGLLGLAAVRRRFKK